MRQKDDWTKQLQFGNLSLIKKFLLLSHLVLIVENHIKFCNVSLWTLNFHPFWLRGKKATGKNNLNLAIAHPFQWKRFLIQPNSWLTKTWSAIHKHGKKHGATFIKHFSLSLNVLLNKLESLSLESFSV